MIPFHNQHHTTELWDGNYEKRRGNMNDQVEEKKEKEDEENEDIESTDDEEAEDDSVDVEETKPEEDE